VLPEETKEPLLRFVARFPTVSFYKDDAAGLDVIEEALTVTLPRWLRAICQTLHGVEPERRTRARFDTSIHPFIIGDELRESWYRIGPFGPYYDEERPLLESMEGLRLLPIARHEVTGESTLAINLADRTDQRIYEYRLENLQDEKSSGSAIEQFVFPMFTSYADMFDQVVGLSLLMDDGTRQVVDAHR